MKLVLLLNLLFTVAFSNALYRGGSIAGWKPPGHGDFRGPCPMMNTLANHGYLPHDGKNLTKDTVIHALSAGLNFNASLGSIMFDMGVVVNPEPNATYFTLDQLNQHNILEHDGSLSRSDAFFGNNHIFNATIFNETRSYWTSPILTADMLANSKVARQVTSRSSNPTYTFTSTTQQFSLGEVSAPIIAFGDMESGTVNRSLVEYFFENERLPAALGWTRKSDVIGLEKITRMSQMMSNASSLLTTSQASAAKRRSLSLGGHFKSG